MGRNGDSQNPGCDSITTAVILQSAYIPWKGYFELIDRSDIFVFYDSAQYTKRSWINRNKIATPNGMTWLSIPVKADLTKSIDETLLPDGDWKWKHSETIRRNYGKTDFVDDAFDILDRRLSDSEISSISELNQILIRDICDYLGIEHNFLNSRDLEPTGGRVGKLIDICNKLGADTYLSGPAAKSYIQNEFDDSGINLEWMEYGPYKEYSQFGDAFEHGVSILDTIAHCGKRTIEYCFRRGIKE